MKGLCQKKRKEEESFSKEMRLFFCGSFAKATSVAEEIESDVSIRFLLKGGKLPSDIVRLRRKCVFYYYFS